MGITSGANDALSMDFTGSETHREGNHGNARGVSRDGGESDWSEGLPEH